MRFALVLSQFRTPTVPCASLLDGIFTGFEINPFKVKKFIGVVKAYKTRLCAAPMPPDLLVGKDILHYFVKTEMVQGCAL
jgi:adenylosuccinate synthase